MIRGFLLGKFMPPHNGHIYLVQSALGMVDELTVLVCSTDAEEINGRQRFDWMRESCPGARVLHMHKDIPQGPSEHHDFWAIWKRAIHDYHPENIDYVFGSENYIFQLAEHLNAKPILIDPKREIFDISGTKIRRDPYGNWDHLPKPVRRSYAKRVCLLGPESSGKSVLSQKLATHYETCLMLEYGRIYDENYKQIEHFTDDQSRRWSASEFVILAKTHIAMCSALMGDANRLLIEDTDILQTVIWEEKLMGANSAAMMSLLEDTRLADFYIVLSPAERFIDDGGRYFPGDKVRQDFFEQAVGLLKDRDLAYCIIDEEDRKLREQKAQKAIDGFFNF